MVFPVFVPPVEEGSQCVGLRFCGTLLQDTGARSCESPGTSYIAFAGLLGDQPAQRSGKLAT